MARYATVLFDLDGTLIDSIRLILDSYHHTLAAFGLPDEGDGAWLRGIGTPLRVQLTAWAKDEAMLDAMVTTYREYNLAHHDAQVVPYRGIANVVQTLRAGGVRVGVVTSKNRLGTLRGLRVAGLEEHIEAIVTSEDVVNPKPHREPVDRAVALLDADPRRTLFVGDSEHDMRSGRSAAVATGAALWGPFRREDLAPYEPTHWLAAPDDVIGLALD